MANRVSIHSTKKKQINSNWKTFCNVLIVFLKFLLFLYRIALTVRYLTRRYIGEYRSKTDLLYRQTISLDSGLLDVEIVDISTETDDDFPTEQIQWADSCLIVYSITDRESFKYATKALGNLKSLQSGPSAYLIANKSDLDHLRTVSAAFYFIFRFKNVFFSFVFVLLCLEIVGSFQESSDVLINMFHSEMMFYWKESNATEWRMWNVFYPNVVYGIINCQPFNQKRISHFVWVYHILDSACIDV